jgi:hypothetical protein
MVALAANENTRSTFLTMLATTQALAENCPNAIT